ncbi:hypothetical protein Bca52824_024202 [Brassica carinata]|uniref:Uncharacterized protein n=1 Tax=Brassica carinata TaxID=52824 RepID=A0A8X7VKN4_BRACI|nr:hypothetical protein Bca52824_024202 [Brassica carinata]
MRLKKRLKQRILRETREGGCRNPRKLLHHHMVGLRQPARRSSRLDTTPKAIAVRNRPRKSTDPKKFTTPEHTTRTRARSRWVSSPFTEADTDEIEGRKKKPRTEA